ncbi:hypothetical protein VVD49_15165 [Uliginosibacterium sp. H3]|uniref:Sec-independent protein translocase protein TatC n=1 Tax=Uliginosibacterium silvisoli TaxID=3114758 RepID=A0ABU6K6F1_9RHOO|nr:hypothetical protein [Uliginosibacterium sp. H3]
MKPAPQVPHSRAPRARPVFSTSKPARAEPLVLPMMDRVLQASALATTLTVVLIFALNPLTQVWHNALNALIEWLSLDAQVIERSIRLKHATLGSRLGLSIPAQMPDTSSLTLHGLMCVGIFGLSWAVRSMPLRCGLRLLCGLHGLGLLMVVMQGEAFPYSLLEHTRVLYDSSLIWLLLTPALLGAGFFLVERSWPNRIAAALLIIGFEIFALPIKLALHSVLVALLSPAVIPLLFLGAGPVLDILLLAALYAWVLTWPQLKFTLK